MKTKILICGATGFIGRNMAEYFSRHPDYEVFGTCHHTAPFDCPGLQWISADLTQTADVQRALRDMNVIIQAAATTSGAKDIVQKPYIHVTDNAVMNSLLFRAAFENRVSRVVFFSCTVMYPSRSQPVKESDFDANAELHHNYFGVGWTKVYLEKMCEFYSRIGSTQFTVIRHSNIYGPYDKYDLERSHVFGATMTKVLQARDNRIVVWGTGEEKRDLLYVSDLVRFVEMALDRQKTSFALFNVGCGSAVSILDLVKRIVVLSGKALSIEHDLSKPTIPTSLALDISKAANEIGWTPQVSLDEGIRKTIAWYRQHFNI